MRGQTPDWRLINGRLRVSLIFECAAVRLRDHASELREQRPPPPAASHPPEFSSRYTKARLRLGPRPGPSPLSPASACSATQDPRLQAVSVPLPVGVLAGCRPFACTLFDAEYDSPAVFSAARISLCHARNDVKDVMECTLQPGFARAFVQR